MKTTIGMISNTLIEQCKRMNKIVDTVHCILYSGYTVCILNSFDDLLQTERVNSSLEHTIRLNDFKWIWTFTRRH